MPVRCLFILIALTSMSACFDVPQRSSLGGSCEEDNNCLAGICVSGTCLEPNYDEDGDGVNNWVEKEIGTHPLKSDSDGDNIPDPVEIGDSFLSPPDQDGDGAPDAVESAIEDQDKDCLPDDRDPENHIPNKDNALLKAVNCPTLGICINKASEITVTCNNGVPKCDYSAIENYDGPQESLCDGIDGDCDGLVDDDFYIGENRVGQSCPPYGACGEGMVECHPDGISAVCSTRPGGSANEATEEICDNVDNDCDGEKDEDLNLDGAELGAPCVGVGVCKGGPGIIECDPFTQLPTCSVNQGGSQSLASLEICDGLDNDCDGVIDEDLLYDSPDGTALVKGEPCGAGPCDDGVVVCADDGVLTCSTLFLASDEVCDGIDNDCDGQTDEEMFYLGLPLGADCSGLGECGGGVVECVEATGGVTCSSLQNGSQSQATEEVCDGLDNDCDGLSDEGLVWNGLPVGTECVGVGACGTGVVECIPGSLPQCSSMPGGSEAQDGPELCDGIDNDCDDLTDEELLGDGSDCNAQGVCLPVATAICAQAQWICELPDAFAGYEPDTEASCDNLDNDCDGETDEGLPKVFGSEWNVIATTSPQPEGRIHAAFAYDPLSQTLYIHGGESLSEEGTTVESHDTWALDLVEQTWTLLTGETEEPLPAQGTLAWDPTEGTLLLMEESTNDGEPTLWKWESSLSAWTSLSEETSGSAGNSTSACVVYDAHHRRWLQFSDGSESQGASLSTLNMETLTWEQSPLNPALPPESQFNACLWDPDLKATFLVIKSYDESTPIRTLLRLNDDETSMVLANMTITDGAQKNHALLLDPGSNQGIWLEGQSFSLFDIQTSNPVPLETLSNPDLFVEHAVAFFSGKMQSIVLFGGENELGDISDVLRINPSVCP